MWRLPKKKDIYDLGDPTLTATFLKFIDRLKRDPKYFVGIQEDSPEYYERVELAKAKFLSMHQQQQHQQGVQQQQTTTTTTTTQTGPAPQAKELAEKHKTEGNQKLSANLYPEAIESYTKAISLNPENPIYYSNRAAAYTQLNQNEKAIEDCDSAISKDPNYTKAYSRLGLAYFNLGRYKEAAELGYRKALALEPENKANQESLAQVEAKLREGPSGEAPAGGAPNIGDLLNNPALMNLARNLSSNLQGGVPGVAPGQPPNIANMMNNPAMMSMFQNVMTQPGFSEMMNDPNIINMAKSVAQNPNAMNQIFQGMFTGEAAQQTEGQSPVQNRVQGPEQPPSTDNS